MCEQTEISYLDGDVVWVKLLGSCWWPGEVVGFDKLPPDLVSSFRKPPIAVVKFYQEDTYEYVKNISNIYKYNCSRKNEFINKGLYMYRRRSGHNMEKFPEDVIRAETAVGGDIEILTRDEFQEVKKENYRDIFVDPTKKTPTSGRGGRTRQAAESPKVSTPMPRRYMREKADYKVHILVQPTKDKETPTQPASSPTPSTSRAGSEVTEEKAETPKVEDTPTKPVVTTPAASSTGCYQCPSCNFSTMRMNVLIMHNKTHSVTYIPYTPSPVNKKPIAKSAKSSPKATPKTSRPRKEKADKPPKKPQGKKRPIDDKADKKDIKKPKTDAEIKSSLLADWDDGDDDSNDESSGLLLSRSPEIPIGAESPAAPIPAELPRDLSSPVEKKSEPESSEKPECSSDSKYEFCEDEDWPEEADFGRKIPRVKNPSIRKEETKSLSVEDEIDVAREVAELLNKTAVPELPSVPEPLKVEENFPEPSIVKSPDKTSDVTPRPGVPDNPVTETKPTKTIFKTKTFFRSRHSRSQDAIGKYVAEQLNAAERMDLSENELNGSEVVSSPEARESPPVEPVKVARLAPKIQLKKMKAEAAQLREKMESEQAAAAIDVAVENLDSICPTTSLKDVLYPTQEIKPVNRELPDKLLEHEDMQDNAVMSTVEKMDIDKDIIDRQYTTVNSIYPSNNTMVPEKFLETSPEKTVEHQIIVEQVAFDQNMTSTKEDQFDINVRAASHSPFEVKSIVEGGTNKAEIDGFKQSEIKHKTLSVGIKSIIEDGKNKIEIDGLNQSKTNLSAGLNTSSPEKPTIPTFKDNITILPENSTESPPLSNYQKQQNMLKSFQPVIQPYMNESTASAVDALLSVSRETDRVTKIVSKDLPEDLFEDDNKDGGITDSYELSGPNNVHRNEVVESSAMLADHTNGVTHQDDNVNIVNQGNLSEEAKGAVNVVVLEVSNDNNVPSESDLQIAEALINLPSSAVQNNNSKEHNDVGNAPTFLEDQFVEEVVLDEKAGSDNNTFETKVIETVTTESSELPNDKNINIRFETEQEKSENLNAAQSLVQMSESMDHTLNIVEIKTVKGKELLSPKAVVPKQNNGINKTVEQKVALLSNDNKNEPLIIKSPKFETTSSKLLKMLEEPSTLKVPVNKLTAIKQTTPAKQVIVSGREKILNFDVAKSSMKTKVQAPKQKIIIRRTGSTKNLVNMSNLSEVVASPDKIILSRSNVPSIDGSSVQTFTIKAPDVPKESKQIIMQPKIRKIAKPATKLQKIKPQESLIVQSGQKIKPAVNPVVDEAMFDINSMPVVLSDDILTPESIEKMPIVMTDGKLLATNPQNTPTPPTPTPKVTPPKVTPPKVTPPKVTPPKVTPPKVIKAKPTIIENEKIAISAVPTKTEVKTLLMNAANSDINKAQTTPNILSKSAKLRGPKPMLVIDKATGKQKIIMTKGEPALNEIKPAPTIIQQVPHTATTAKPDKFIILPTASSPRPPGRTQKIVIDPSTGKAHVLVTKGQEPVLSVAENKPVSAKLIQTSSENASAGNTVMIITNAQGTQSRIILTPEHEKILFPNKHQPNVSQLKALTQRITPTITNTSIAPKTIVTSMPIKGQTKIVPKQKGAIITSKGQLIVGGRVATTTHNIAPMPEIRPTLKPVTKRIIAAEPKKIIQTIQKTSSEPLILLQQKSGALMQLTPAQFDHLQRTGQIVHKAPPPENKIVVQKSITISPKEPLIQTVHKQRVRKSITASPSPVKKAKHEIAIAPALVPALAPAPTPTIVAASTSIIKPASPLPLPPLTSISNTVHTATASISNIIPSVSNTVSVSTTSDYTECLENFEELLPSTSIARQPEVIIEPLLPQVPPPPPPEPEPVVEQQIEPIAEPPAQISDGQLLAVPGENFGGPPGSFYLCVEDNGTLTPIDNRPLVLENNQLVPMALEPAPVYVPQPERRDILEAALANSDVFHAESPREEVPDFRDLNANVSVHCHVSETSTTLNQPRMAIAEVPSKGATELTTVASSLEDGLAVIGVTPHTIPTSLELPITVTDPRIAPKTTDPLSNSNYASALLTSPNTDMPYITSEEIEVSGPISMPLLTDEETVGKSMPILTDDVTERTVSSVESAVGSPSSMPEAEEGAAWSGTRRLLTPGSDISDTSSEIPLQPAIQLSVNDLVRPS